MAIVKTFNISIWLTLTRLVISPLVLPFLLVYFLPYNSVLLNIMLGIIFILFGLTDFLDGYLARRYQQETAWGKILDPIADKFFIYSTLIALLAVQKIYFFWVIVFIGRELFMMGLRSIAAEYRIAITVSYGAKFKTVVQMLLLLFLIVQPCFESSVIAPFCWITESLLLYSALALSLITAYHYYMIFVKQIRERYEF